MDELENIRKKMINLSLEKNLCHLAPALSCIDMIYVLYKDILTKDDKFILSKGHACISLYTILREIGLNPNVDCGHPDIDIKNGIECTTGSLGHGLPIAVGMAFAKKIKGEKGHIYVLMGDGECQEGTTWESLLIASRYKLNNLTIIIDKNNIQAIDFIDNILPLGDLKQKFKVFGCNCIELFDGHNINSFKLVVSVKSKDKPIAIISNTIKGKGLTCSENKPDWHARTPKKEDLDEKYLC